jgi:GTPase SAR1 family protein
MLSLVIQSAKLAESGHETAVTEANQPLVKSFLDCADEDDEGNLIMKTQHFTANVETITKLWEDTGIQATLSKSNLFQLNTSAAYFFNNIARVASPEYLPSEADLMHTRKPTVGLVETSFTLDGVKFVLIDVGGQRNERKKWMGAFSSVTLILFVAAISEYDEVLEEDEKTNRMIETLNLFGQVCNSGWFGETNPPMMLFLNKSDLFREKLSRVSLSTLFPEYTGGSDPEAGMEFLEQRFLQEKKANGDVYTHRSVATSSENMNALLSVVTTLVIEQNLASAGFMT